MSKLQCSHKDSTFPLEIRLPFQAVAQPYRVSPVIGQPGALHSGGNNFLWGKVSGLGMSWTFDLLYPF